MLTKPTRNRSAISDTGGAAAVTGVYDRNEYLSDKRKALDAWATLLAQMASPCRTSRALLLIAPCEIRFLGLPGGLANGRLVA